LPATAAAAYKSFAAAAAYKSFAAAAAAAYNSCLLQLLLLINLLLPLLPLHTTLACYSCCCL